MQIITVSREFGSGGRELGKRLADALGFAYYDREIIAAIAEKSRMDERYVAKTLESGAVRGYPITFGRTFTSVPAAQGNVTKLLVAQQQVIRELAAQEKDCVIVGRGADVILSEQNPFHIFVYADREAKLQRCRERASAEEMLTDRQMEKKMRQVDASRAGHRELLNGSRWGRKEGSHLCVNTTGLDLKELAPLIAEYSRFWFRRERK